jgi:hypothetical protein
MPNARSPKRKGNHDRNGRLRKQTVPYVFRNENVGLVLARDLCVRGRARDHLQVQALAQQVQFMETAVNVCACNHETERLVSEIASGRYMQKYQQDATGCYELICVKCGGQWDHRATDRVIDRVMGDYLRARAAEEARLRQRLNGGGDGVDAGDAPSISPAGGCGKQAVRGSVTIPECSPAVMMDSKVLW